MVETKFTNTELGLLPEDWNVRGIRGLLCLLTDFDANGSFDDMANNVSTSDGSGFAWYVRATDLEQGTTLDKVKYVDKKSYNFLKKTALFGGEVLIAKRGDIGKVYLFEMKTQYATLAPNLYLLKLNDEVNAGFLFYYLKSALGQKKLKSINASTSLGAIYKEDVKNLLLPFPQKSEQTRIAKALSDIDALLVSLDKLISKKMAIKRGMMQQLLTGQKRLHGFNKPWKRTKIGELGELQKGSIYPFLYPNDDFVEYSMPAFDAGQTANICKGNTMSSARTTINGKVLLINKLNVRQKRIWLVNADSTNSVCSGEFLPFESTECSLEYLRQLLLTDSIVKEWIENSTGTSNSQKRIRPSYMLSYCLFIPSELSEQIAIANILDDMDAEITELESKKAKYTAIKQGMMQQLLTGKIRLI